MQRKTLLDALEVVEPALAANALIPILAHFWFKKDTVMAYNDQIAIETPFDAGFNGALPGSVLMRLLKASRAKEIDIHPDGHEVNLSLSKARTKFKLPMLTEDSFVFKMPVIKGIEVSTLKLVPGFKHCLRSIATDTSVPEQLGVTCSFEPGAVKLYSSNGATLSHALVDLQENEKKMRVTLPASFCKEVCKRVGKGDKIIFGKDGAMAIRDGDTTVYTRLILPADKPLNFEDVLAVHMPKGMESFAMPQRMALAVTRACVIADSNTEQQSSMLTVEDGQLTFYTKSLLGEAVDHLAIDEPSQVEIKVVPEYLKSCEEFEYINLTPNCVVMSHTKKHYIYIVAAHGK